MSWAANFVATLQNTFNSHGTHKIRCSFNTIIIINVKWKKGTRTLATNEEWKKKSKHRNEKLESQPRAMNKTCQANWRMGIIIPKTCTKNVHRETKMAILSAPFLQLFFLLALAPMMIIIVIIIIWIFKRWRSAVVLSFVRGLFFHSSLSVYFLTGFFPCIRCKMSFSLSHISRAANKKRNRLQNPGKQRRQFGRVKKNNCTQNNNPHCFSALKLNEYECRKLVSFHFASLVFPILILCMWLCGWRFFFVC